MTVSRILMLHFFLVLTAWTVAQPTHHAGTAAAQELLDQTIATGVCTGIAAGFSVDGTVVWESGAGFRDLDKQLPFEATTSTRIASVTKPMTAVAIMQLYEQGKLDLDASVQIYIPDFPEGPKGTITVRHLLQHSSGIDGYQSNKERENQEEYADLEAAVGIFRARELLFTPGQSFHYTSYGYTVLGLIIERVSGMTFEAYLKEHLWEPAGMTHTGVERLRTDNPGQARLYHRKDNGKIKEAKPTNLSDRIPGGGVYSNVGDLLRFGQAILQHKLLQPETLDLMWSDSGLKQQGNPYGLGWYLYGENPKYGPVYGHNGAQTGSSAFLMLLPEQNTTVVVLSNTSGAMQEVTNVTIQLFDMAAQAKGE